MGFITTGQAEAAGNVTASLGLPVIASNVSGESLTKNLDNVVVIPGRLHGIGAATVDFCNQYFGGTKVANINPDFSYVDELEAGEREEIERLNMELVSNQQYEAGTQNFSPYVTAVRSANPDCIMTGDLDRKSVV